MRPRKTTVPPNASPLSHPPPTQEIPADQLLLRAQESAQHAQAEAERAKQVLLDAEKAVLEARRNAEAAKEIMQRRVEEEAQRKEKEIRRAEAKKREEEMRRAEEEEERQRLEDAKQKEDLKASRKNHSKGKARAVVEDEDEEEGEEEEEEEEEEEIVSRKPAIKTYSRKKGPKTPAMVDDSGKNISADLVHGGLYPSCLACFNTKKVCQWKRSVIHFRLALIPNKARNCENCIRLKESCQLIWDHDETLKRPAESAIEPQSPKRIKTDPLVVASLDSLHNQVGALLKLTTAQGKKNSKENQLNAGFFADIKSALDALREGGSGA